MRATEKIAIVCSWLNQYGGAERVLEVIHNLYPDAPIYTSIFEPRSMPDVYRSWDIRTSFMQRLPLVKRHHQPFLPLYPLAFEQLDLRGYDLVLSVTSAFAHGIVTRPETCHICYCLTPARFLWSFADYTRREALGRRVRGLLAPAVAALRVWDVAAAQRVDRFVAISQAVARRIDKYYRRDSAVIYPPVDTSAFHHNEEPADFFLVVSRLIPYKRIELAVQACSELGLPLKVVGDGRDRAALQRIAGPSVQFLGRLDDVVVKDLYARCRALIFPGEEDFGLTPLEAQASGRPVIAYGAGGALETVVEGESGVFFAEPTAESLARALLDFRPGDYEPARIQQHARRFDVNAFNSQFTRQVAENYAEYSGRPLVLRS